MSDGEDDDDDDDGPSGKKKKKFHLDREHEDVFAEFLKAHTVLVNSKDSKYHKSGLRAGLWKEITTTIGKSEEYLLGWLKSKRTRLEKKTAKMLSGSGVEEVQGNTEDAWMLQNLFFMLRFVKRKRAAVTTVGGLKSTLKGRSQKEARNTAGEEPDDFTLQLVKTPKGNFCVIDTAYEA
ncbi:MAG: hypothetical protein GY707_12470, partial [Desulfobacteraceae bacterium]|nr:hypothetical protein [Desulfobacteraceae bacterium]